MTTVKIFSRKLSDEVKDLVAKTILQERGVEGTC